MCSYLTLDEALLSYYLSSAIWLCRSSFSKMIYSCAYELGLSSIFFNSEEKSSIICSYLSYFFLDSFDFYRLFSVRSFSSVYLQSNYSLVFRRVAFSFSH